MQGPADSVTAQTIARNIGNMRSTLSTLQEEISTNRKSDLATQDPQAARTVLSLRHEAENATAEIETANTALTRSEAADEALGTVRETVKQAREAAIGAPRGDTQVGLGSAAAEARDAAQQIVDTLNVEVAGQRLFAGQKTGTAPMAQNIGDVRDGDPGNTNTALAMVEERLQHMSGLPEIDQIETEGDALRAVSQATATATADANALATSNTKVQLEDGQNVGEVHIETVKPGAGAGTPKEDRLTVALDRDFDAQATPAGTQIAFEVNGQTLETTVGADAQTTVQNIETEINAEIGGTVNGTGTTVGGLDANFRDKGALLGGGGPTETFSSLLYNGDQNDLTARVKGSDTAYSTRADNTAIRDVMEGLLLEAAADRPAGERAPGIERQENPSAPYDPENEGVNALRDMAIERMTAGMDKLAEERGKLGIAQRNLETARESLETTRSLAEKQATDVESVDRAAAITKLQNVQANLQASYQVTSRLQQLSLARSI